MKPSKTNAERTVHLITYVTDVAIMAFYSAALISFLTVETTRIPFTTMQGLVDDGTYKMGVVSGTAEQVILKVVAYFCCFY